QALRLHQQVLVHGAGQIGVAGQEFTQRLPAARAQPLGGDLRADEADVLAGGPARRRFEGGDGAPGDVGLEEVEVEGALAVDLPEQRLGLVAALGRLDAPEVDPAPYPWAASTADTRSSSPPSRAASLIARCRASDSRSERIRESTPFCWLLALRLPRRTLTSGSSAMDCCSAVWMRRRAPSYQ